MPAIFLRKTTKKNLFLSFIHSNYYVSTLALCAPKLLGISCQSKLAILSALVNYSSIVDSSLIIFI